MEFEKEIQQTVFKSQRHKAMLNLIFTASWMSCKEQRLFKAYGLTPQQYNVLRILRGQKGNPISVNGIQDRMLDRNSNASRLIDKLLEKKLADRVICEKDRRQVDVLITEKALDLLSQIDLELESKERAFAPITEEEAAELSRILDKIRS